MSPLIAVIAIAALVAVYVGYRKVSQYTPSAKAPVVERAQAGNPVLAKLNQPVGPTKKVEAAPAPAPAEPKGRFGRSKKAKGAAETPAPAAPVVPAAVPPVPSAPAPVPSAPAMPQEVAVAAAPLVMPQPVVEPALQPAPDAEFAGLSETQNGTAASPYARNIVTDEGRIALPDDNEDDFQWSWKSAASRTARPIAETGAMMDGEARVTTTEDGRIALPVAAPEVAWASESD